MTHTRRFVALQHLTLPIAAIAVAWGITGAASLLSGQQQQSDKNTKVGVLPIRGNVYMLVAGGVNITVQVGDGGILVVDPGPASSSEAVLAAIRGISKETIHYVIDTNALPEHTGGNTTISKAGESFRGMGLGADIIAHLGIDELMRAQKPERLDTDLPTDTFNTPQKDFWFDDQAVILLQQPAAHAEGDTLVHLRGADVIAAGEVFVQSSYPLIRLDQGGSIDGELKALNQILKITVPNVYQSTGTIVVPGRGHLSDETDVAQYRDALTIIRDRIKDMIKKGMTLAQVKDARPTADYDPMYSPKTGSWTTEMFIEAVYNSLRENNEAAKK